MSRTVASAIAVVLILATTACGSGGQNTQPKSGETPSPAVTPDQARAIAKEAYIYGFPIVDSYRVQYAYSVDKNNPAYKGEWNQIHNTARVFTPADTAIQTPNSAGYQVQPLSAFLSQPPPADVPRIDFVPPLTPDQQKTSPQFFDILNFALKFAPTLSAEQDLRTRFATIGIGPDRDFDVKKLSPEIASAIEGGIADAWGEFNAFKKDKVDTGQVGSAEFFGTANYLNGNYLYRMAGAVLGIYGNTAAEAIYPGAFNDASGSPLSGANTYTYRFPPGQLPPVNAFWSLIMYELPQSLLVTNPINRYLINSPMLGSLIKDPDGGITLYLQNSSPGPDKEANWLPAPAGPFVVVLRLYWPKQEALDAQWTAPKPVKV
jgi:hypothetical protein